MKSAGIFLLSLTMAVVLTGCDVADKIPLTPHDVAKLAGKFGVPTREELSGNDTEGRTYELMVESQREANWREADFALWRGLRVTCPDGRRGTTISSSPAERTDAEQTRMHPPGTVFRRVITCPPPPEFEFRLAEGLSREEINWIFHERLNADNIGFPRDPVVLPVLYAAGRPKYQAIEQTLGKVSLQWAEKCGGNLNFTKLAVAVLPDRPAGAEPDFRRADAYIGFIVDCQQPEPSLGGTQEAALIGDEDSQP